MQFSELKVGDKFKFVNRQPILYIKTSCESNLHKEAGGAKYDVDYPTVEWPVWNDEEVIKII